MKNILEFFGILGLLFCILALFSLAELAYGGTVDDLLNYQYKYQTDTQDCTIEFATNAGLSGYNGFGLVQVQCTERAGTKYETSGTLSVWQLTSDVVTVDGNKFAVGQSGDIYPICGTAIERRD